MKDVIKWIGSTLIVLGILLALGTAGASDVDAICIDMAIVRVFIALVMVASGLVINCIIEKKENEK